MVQRPWSNHAEFPDTENIGSFALYKNFTLFEIVNELVSKEEPLYFNPQTLQEPLHNPNPRKEAHQIQREMQHSVINSCIRVQVVWMQLVLQLGDF
jgi:hypothetical protein